MSYVATFEVSSGRCVACIYGESPAFVEEHYLSDGIAAVGVGAPVSGYTHYILNGEVTERPTSPVSRTDLTLLDVPTGSKLRINGESYDAAGTVELEFPLSGTYSLRVECFPYLDWTDVVTV